MIADLRAGPRAPPRRDVTDTIPCGALSRGRSFVNYFADRVIRCGENRERGDRARRSVGGKGRERARRGCAYDVGHAGETQRDIRRAHSWAPRRDVKSYLSLGPRFIRRSAVPRCTRSSAHSPRHRRPRFLFDLHRRVGPVPRKKTRARETISDDGPRLLWPASPQAKIYIQFIFKMKGVSADDI